MPTFAEDLSRAFGLTMEISVLRAKQLRPLDVEPLMRWQQRAFMTIVEGDGLKEIEQAWNKLHEAPATRVQAELLHEEVSAIIAVQLSALELHSSDEANAQWRPQGYLKKAVGLFKTLLESLKEVLGEHLSLPWKIALQIAIEASEAFAK